MRCYFIVLMVLCTFVCAATPISKELPYSFEQISLFYTECQNGPSSVIKSLAHGLAYFPVRYNSNPGKPCCVHDIAVVLADADNLKKVIEWKKAGRVRYIFAGPNITVSFDGQEHILAREEVDVILVPSEWVRQGFIKDNPRLEPKIRVWYAGVDERVWKRSENMRHVPDNNVLVYVKNYEHGWNPMPLVYGSYNHTLYREMLSKSTFAVFLSRSESQGIALAEAWAMDVPTLVWNPQDLVVYGKRFDPSSSCPYLTAQTGLDWKTPADLEKILKNMKPLLKQFHPRTWIVQHMTDAISAGMLLNIIEETFIAKGVV